MAAPTTTAVARTNWDAIFFLMIPLRPGLPIPDIGISPSPLHAEFRAEKWDAALPARLARGRIVKPYDVRGDRRGSAGGGRNHPFAGRMDSGAAGVSARVVVDRLSRVAADCRRVHATRAARSYFADDGLSE